MVESFTSKAFRTSRSQMFYKIGVLKNFSKFTEKHLIVHSYDLCGIFKNTYFLITPQNQATHLRKQISKVT